MITYDQFIENNYLRFNVAPVQTGIASIQHIPTKNDMFVKLSSGKSGMGFYNYGN